MNEKKKYIFSYKKYKKLNFYFKKSYNNII